MNRLTKKLGIELPVIQGGMGNISNAELAAAISNAGGLGTIGVGTMNPDELEKLIQRIQHLTKKPFALNLPINVNPNIREMLDLVWKYSIPIISLSAGNPAPYIPLLHSHDVTVMVVTGSVKHAVKAEKAGADVIVAEGYEAAGINSPFETTTLTLIPQVVDAVTIPVVAAGGIADGRGLLAALSLGAEGVQMGTRFIATKEAPFSNKYKRKIIEAEDHSTFIIGRNHGKIRRVLKGNYAINLSNTETELSDDQFNEATSEKYHLIGALEGDENHGYMNSGQIAGLIHHEPTVAELLEEMMDDCRKRLKNIGNLLED